jgi:hypothetical protein
MRKLGPALRRTAKYEMAWLYKWIKSSELIKWGSSGGKVYEENNKQ